MKYKDKSLQEHNLSKKCFLNFVITFILFQILNPESLDAPTTTPIAHLQRFVFGSKQHYIVTQYLISPAGPLGENFNNLLIKKIS